MAESNLEIKVTASGAKTLGEMRQEVARLKKEVLGLVPGTKEFAKLSELAGQKQTAVNQAMSMGWSESARMKDAYFRTGLEVRQLILSSNSLSPALRNVAVNLDQGVTNALQLRKALSLMNIEIGAIGVAAVAAVPLVVGFFQQAKEEAKRFAEEMRKVSGSWTDFLLGSSGTSPEEKKNLIENQIQVFKDRKTAVDAMVKTLQERLSPTGGAFGREVDFVKRLALQSELNKQLGESAQLELNIATWQQKQFDLKESQIKAAIELGKTAERLAGEQRQRDVAAGFGTVPKRAPTTGPFAFAGVTVGEQNTVFKRNPMQDKSLWDAWEKQDAFESEIATKRAKEINKELTSGAKQFSNTLLTALMHGQDMSKAIGMALLGIFVDVATGGIVSLLNKAAPVPGVPSLSANKGSRSVSLIDKPQLVTKWKADEMAVFVERGNTKLSRRRK